MELNPYLVAKRQHRQGKARQGKRRQHEPRAQMTHSEWLVSGWSCCQQTWWPYSSSTLLACFSQPCHGCESSFWRVFGCKGGWLHFPPQIEFLYVISWVKGLLHIHLNLLAFKIPGSINFLTSICIYIPQNIYAAKKSSPSFSYTRNSYTVLGL